jgi:hypothetical protein
VEQGGRTGTHHSQLFKHNDFTLPPADVLHEQPQTEILWERVGAEAHTIFTVN